MARRRSRPLVRSVAVAVCLLVAAGSLTASAGEPTELTTQVGLRVLQMNLCDSGIADCYTGRSVAEAAAVIRANEPDVITLNEVCRDDVNALDQTMAATFGGGVVSAFRAADDRRTGTVFPCRNGQPYGIGVVAHIRVDRGTTTYSGIYPIQDLRDPEERAWVCVDAVGSFYACTTHLADTSRTVALAQCGYLWGTVLPGLRTPGHPYTPIVVGGDLNLSPSASANLHSCVPAADVQANDGGVQYVVATPDFTVTSRRPIDMARTTDHPGLLVSFNRRSTSSVASAR